jgi:hypothetical protein
MTRHITCHAMGVHWVYDPEVLAGLGKGRGGLEFMDPPQRPFFAYPPGELVMGRHVTSRRHVTTRHPACLSRVP